MDRKRDKQELRDDIGVRRGCGAPSPVTPFFALIADIMTREKKGIVFMRYSLPPGGAACEKEEKIPWDISVSKI
jgi:hypothetical protein